MGLQKKYGSAKALYEGIKSYFDSITRRDLVTEQKDTGKLDRYGHKIFIPVPAKNGKGEEIYRTVYLIPPSVGDLCDHLQIHLSTWRRYCAEEKFREVTEWANDRFVNWRFSEAVVRPDKMTKGLIWDAEKNYLRTDAHEIETIEDDGLIAALSRSADSLFDDGDDSDMLPEVGT